MASYASYVICTSPRSGSTLLCNLLTATGVAGRPASYFHCPSITSWMNEVGMAVDQSAPERDTLSNVFRAIMAEGSGSSDMFGLRLQRHSFDYFTRKLAVLHPIGPDRRRFEAAFGKTAFIHLTRTDKVEQAVSYVKAEQSGLWHMAADGTELERLSPPREPVYDAAEIEKQFNELTAFDRDWARWFESQDIKPFRITYEALSAHPIDTLRSTLEALGLDPHTAKGLKPGVAKLADALSEDWVARFRRQLGTV